MCKSFDDEDTKEAEVRDDYGSDRSVSLTSVSLIGDGNDDVSVLTLWSL